MRKRQKFFPDWLKRNLLYVVLFFLFFLAYIILFYRNILVYMLILIFSAYIHYRHYKGFPTINLGHIYFFAFIIDWHDGLGAEILFILLAGVLPEILAGYFEPKTIFTYLIMIGIISLPIYLIHSNYILMGVISSIVYFGIMFIISGFTRDPLHERIFEVIIPCILNIFYFIYLANPLYSLLNLILF